MGNARPAIERVSKCPLDGATSPNIIGTGSEDYYLGAWCYGGCGINPFGGTRPPFAYDEYGNPMNGGDDRGAIASRASPTWVARRRDRRSA